MCQHNWWFSDKHRNPFLVIYFCFRTGLRVSRVWKFTIESNDIDPNPMQSIPRSMARFSFAKNFMCKLFICLFVCCICSSQDDLLRSQACYAQIIIILRQLERQNLHIMFLIYAFSVWKQIKQYRSQYCFH